MQTKTATQTLKFSLVILAAAFAVTGCHDADEHPSQMVKMRDQMQQQKGQMKGGMTEAPVPGNAAATGSTTGK